jgi:hypothetical protein
MNNISLRVPVLILALAILIGISGCQNEPVQPELKQSVAIAVNFDPTTEIESIIQKSEKAISDLLAEEKQKKFRDEIQAAVLLRIVAKLQPSDVLHLSSVSRNSLQTVTPLSCELPTARNNKERQRFLAARENAKQKVEKWFEITGNNPPCPNSKTLCSDIFNSVLASAHFLKSKPARKVLFAFSDMQDNITRIKSFPPDAFRDIDIVILYAFPISKSPKDYEPFRQHLLETFKTGNPRSVRVLFPTEARTFNFEEFMTEIRRNDDND